jgi:hypothetical protein
MTVNEFVLVLLTMPQDATIIVVDDSGDGELGEDDVYFDKTLNRVYIEYGSGE